MELVRFDFEKNQRERATCLAASAARLRESREWKRRALTDNSNLIALLLFFAKPRLLPEPSAILAVEIRTHDGDIILREAAEQLVVEVVPARRSCASVPLLESAATFVDVLFQPIV